jgi:hypothetical protein
LAFFKVCYCPKGEEVRRSSGLDPVYVLQKENLSLEHRIMDKDKRISMLEEMLNQAVGVGDLKMRKAFWFLGQYFNLFRNENKIFV